MKKRIIAGVLSLALTFSALVTFSGCGTTVQATNLMADVRANAESAVVDLNGDESRAIAEFALKLFQNCASPAENTLISPFSVLCALAMTANGAKGETLAQMEQVYGVSVQELNDYLHTYLGRLPAGDKYEVRVANSLWFKDDDKLEVEQSFLQTNADYYGAAVYKAAFDNSTLKEINDWVSDNTEGRIENILDEIPDAAVMYLINALAFDAEWENIYTENQVQDGKFTAESGETRNVEMMVGSEYQYINDASASGFIKYYADRKYAFAALLPNKGVSVTDYVAALTGEMLMTTLDNAQYITVNTAIPMFESAYSVEMSDILKAMGITDAFDANLADFTGLGQSDAGNIFISRVIHKTYIDVDEKGTTAGAATVVEMRDKGTPAAEETITVYLDRPFVYMLLECDTNLPIFIGTVLDLG